jgi:adenine/guanine phosphoribosyltransferase-like PRPP-binding protein
MVTPIGTYPTKVGSQHLSLPLMPISEELAIALLITVDHGVEFARQAGAEIAEQLAPYNVDVVVSVATMGIPIAIEVSRALGLDDYVILQKTPKIHLSDAIAEEVRSITTSATQRLLFDRERISAVQGQRVGLVDDVVSTGASLQAALRLLRRVGGEPVAIGTLLTEAGAWRNALGADADLVHPLGAIPLFRRSPKGELQEDWQGEGGPVEGAGIS